MNSHEGEEVSRAALKGEALRDKGTLAAFEGDFSQGAKTVAQQEAEAKRKHKREMRAKDLGWLGRFLGGERSAPLTLAFLAIVASVMFMIATLCFEAKWPDDSSIWNKVIDGSFTIMSTSLAYAFGRGAGKS